MLSIIETMLVPSARVGFANSTYEYQCLCSFKVNVLSPSMGMFFYQPPPHHYARVLPCTCVFLASSTYVSILLVSGQLPPSNRHLDD